MAALILPLQLAPLCLVLLGLDSAPLNEAAKFERWQEQYAISPYTSAADKAMRFAIWAARLRQDGPRFDRFFDRSEEERKSIVQYRPEAASASDVTPFRKLPQAYIDMALKANVDWRKRGVVNVAKGQTGGNCGTWARASAGESAYALGGGGGSAAFGGWPHGRPVNQLRNFSEQQSLDCVPPGQPGSWFFYHGGFESLEDYPTSRTDHGNPGGAPCKLDKTKLIPKTGLFTNRTDPQHAVPG